MNYGYERSYSYPYWNADHALRSAVWNKGRPIHGFNPDVYRHDACGHPIAWAEHGNTESKYGWEIDHIVAVANGGKDDLANLQPLYWQTNREKGDQRNWRCA